MYADIATRYAAKNRANRAIVIGWHLSTKNPPLMLPLCGMDGGSNHIGKIVTIAVTVQNAKGRQCTQTTSGIKMASTLYAHTAAQLWIRSSMRIIKQGRPKATKNILRFRCCRCGCEFEADDTEYEQASQIAYVHDGIIATCICPCCGARVYIP